MFLLSSGNIDIYFLETQVEMSDFFSAYSFMNICMDKLQSHIFKNNSVKLRKILIFNDGMVQVFFECMTHNKQIRLDSLRSGFDFTFDRMSVDIFSYIAKDVFLHLVAMCILLHQAAIDRL